MPIELPGIDEIHQRLIDDFKGRFPGFDVSRFSDNWKRLRVMAGGLLGVYHHQDILQDDLFADTAKGTALDRIGFIWDVPRKAATGARKSDALRVTGTLAAALTIGDLLTSSGGLSFQVNENDVIPAALTVDVDILGVSTGVQTRLESGEALTFASPPAGIDAAAILVKNLDEDGIDSESDGDYRVRVLDRIGQPAAGGNSNDYRNFALESSDDIATAFVYPLRRGLGSVDLAALHTGQGSVRLLTAGEQTTLFNFIDDRAKRPVAMALFRVLNVTESQEQVTILLEVDPNGNFAWDWGDDTPPIVSTWTAGTKVLKFTLPRPSDMRKEDRIIIDTALNDGTGEQFEVENLGPAADEITLKVAPIPAPVATDVVYSGGDAVDPVRSAILAYLNQLGPEIGASGTGEWEDTIAIGRLQGVAFGVVGIKSVVVSIPVADVSPAVSAFPADTAVELLTPGQVIVRRDP